MIHSETPSVSLASWSQINRERGVQGQFSQGHGMKSGAQDWNQEVGRWKTLRKGNYKTPMFQGCPTFSMCRAFLSRQAGFWWCWYWNPISLLRAGHPSGDAVSSAGYVQRYSFWTFRRCSCAKKVLLPGRFRQVGWADLGSHTLRFLQM